MQFSTFTVLLALAYPAFAAGSLNDSLFQSDAQDDHVRDYVRLRDKKLASTHFDCGRVIVQPAIAPEYSVSVYSQQIQDRTMYKVTLIKCKSSIWQTTDMGHHVSAGDRIETERMDAVIPDVTAKRLREIWTRIQSGRHAPRPIAVDDFITTDGIEAEFSISVRNKVLRGIILDIGAVQPNSIIGSLVEISKDLVAYCRGNPNKRDGIARRIDERAQALLRRL